MLRSTIGAFIYSFIALTFTYGVMARMSLIRQLYRQSPASWTIAW